MSVRVLLVSVAVASDSAFCVSPKPHLPARRSLPRRPRTMPPQCARIGGRCVDTRIVETKVDPHSNSLATRPWLLALAPRSLPHSFHVPTPPLVGLQEELRRKLQEANAALEELRGSTRKKASWLSKRTSKMVRNPVHLFIRSANGTHWYQVRRALSVWELKNALLALPASPLEDGDELRVCSCAFDSYDLGLKPARTLDNMEETLGETVAHQANYLESLWSSPGSSQ